MSAFYDLYETPDPQKNEEKKPLHARIVPKGTYDAKEFIDRVAHFQHLPANLLNGALKAITDELADLLAEGYNVEVGELGFFSTSLKCIRKATNKKEIRAESIRFNNVHLRTGKNFREKVYQKMQLERAEHSSSSDKMATTTLEQRQTMLLDFIKENICITRAEYSRLTGINDRKASDELNFFIRQGVLRKRGAGRSVVYINTTELTK